MSYFKSLFSLVLVLVLSACIHRGAQFNPQAVNSITRNVTTEQQIRAMFGEPVGVRVNHGAGTRVLVYKYENDDSIKKGAAGFAGALVGGLLGSEIGGGTGSIIASGVGATAGGLLGDNLVDARYEEQILEITISLNTGRVIDYNYLENRGRTQSWGVNGGVGTL